MHVMQHVLFYALVYLYWRKCLQYGKLKDLAIQLRAAQITYMNFRGNEELGKKVGVAAAKLDEVLK